jgi:hypothetical protein
MAGTASQYGRCGFPIWQVRFERGQRVLSVKAPVELINDSLTGVELSMQHNLELQARPIRMAPGERYPLPLQLTASGSEKACWQMLLRPSRDQTDSVRFGWGTLVIAT